MGSSLWGMEETGERRASMGAGVITRLVWEGLGRVGGVEKEGGLLMGKNDHPRKLKRSCLISQIPRRRGLLP